MRSILNALWRARKAVIFYAILLAGGFLLGHALRDIALPEIRPSNEPMIHKIIMTALALFVVAAAIPFVPGAEIGLALLLIFGGQAAPVVYAGMVAALTLSYVLARITPPIRLAGLLRWLGLIGAADLLTDLSSASGAVREARLIELLPHKARGKITKNKYLLLAALLNLPGNSVLGGGGGLAFAAGMSGAYPPIPYLLTVLIAVAPVPLFFAFAM